jgi:hypothetical protein
VALFYRCDNCDWVAEPDDVQHEDGEVKHCTRCGQHTWTPVTDVLALFDAGVIGFCEACERVHSR